MISLNKLHLEELESFVILQEMSKDLSVIDEVGKEKAHRLEVLKKTRYYTAGLQEVLLPFQLNSAHYAN